MFPLGRTRALCGTEGCGWRNPIMFGVSAVEFHMQLSSRCLGFPSFSFDNWIYFYHSSTTKYYLNILLKTKSQRNKFEGLIGLFKQLVNWATSPLTREVLQGIAQNGRCLWTGGWSKKLLTKDKKRLFQTMSAALRKKSKEFYHADYIIFFWG